MYVTSELRSNGGALPLFRRFMSSIKQKGFTQVWANTNADNNRIQTLLTALGFEVMHNPGIEQLEEQVYFKKIVKRELCFRVNRSRCWEIDLGGQAAIVLSAYASGLLTGEPVQH